MARMEDVLADALRNRGASLRWAVVAAQTPPTISLGGTNLSSFTLVGDLPPNGTRIPVLVDGRSIVALGSNLTVTDNDGGATDPGDTLTPSTLKWNTESLAVTVSTASWTLEFVPVPESTVISLNGVVLERGVDYQEADGRVTFLAPANLWLGLSGTWRLEATYPHYDAIPQDGPSDGNPPVGPGAYLGYMQDIDPATSAGTDVITEPVYASDVAFVFAFGTTNSITGVYATWEQIEETITASATWGEISVWKGTGVGTGSIIAVNSDSVPASKTGLVLAVFRDAAEYPLSVRSSVSAFHDPINPGDSISLGTGEAQADDWVFLALRSQFAFINASNPEDPSLWATTGLDVQDTEASIRTNTYGCGMNVLTGRVTEAGVEAVAEITQASNSSFVSLGYVFKWGDL